MTIASGPEFIRNTILVTATTLVDVLLTGIRSAQMNVGLTLYLILYSTINSSPSEAILEVEQSGVLYVCLGGSLNVKCSTSAAKLEWNVTIPHYQRSWSRVLAQLGTAEMATPITDPMNTTITLHISRSLNESLVLPLVSVITTHTVTVELNKTMIRCAGKTLRDNAVLGSSSFQLILIDDNDGSINITPSVNIMEQLGLDRVTVNLEWTHKNGVSYNVSVYPQLAVNYTGRNSAQLTMLYDTKYNISVLASLCGRYSIMFRVINLVTCLQLETDSSVESVSGLDSRHPAVEGTVVSFICPPGTILVGPNITRCTENREWEPTPKHAKCKVDCNAPVVNSNVSLNYASTLEDSLLTFQCKDGLLPDRVFTSRCYRNGSWIPNPLNHVCVTSLAANCGDPSPPSDGYLEPYTSTLEGAVVNIAHVCQNGLKSNAEIICNLEGEWEVTRGTTCPGSESTVNILASIGGSLGSLLAVALLVCGILIVVIVVIVRKKGTTVSSSGEQKRGQSKHQNPEYEEVMAPRNEAVCDEREDLEMMKNVAYGPIQLR